MRSNDMLAHRKRANEARLESIAKRAKDNEAQQAQIRIALQALGSKSESIQVSKHVKFSDSDSEDSDTQFQNKNVEKKSSSALNADNLLGFGEGTADDLSIPSKLRFQGKDAEKLLELQSCYGSDTRFKLDERFAEEDDEDDLPQKDNVEVNDRVGGELSTDMRVLNQIISHVNSGNKMKSNRAEKFLDVSSLRYDPRSEKHLEPKTPGNKPKMKEDSKVNTENAEINADPRRFFHVSTEALRNAFTDSNDTEKNESSESKEEPFSFLKMFGRSQDIADKIQKNEDKPCYAEPEPIKQSYTKVKHDMDGSESDDSDIGSSSHSDLDEISKTLEHRQNNDKTTRQLFCQETFFPLSSSDPRVLHTTTSFCWKKPFEAMRSEYLEVKDILIKDYKKKHKDAKKRSKS